VWLIWTAFEISAVLVMFKRMKICVGDIRKVWIMECSGFYSAK